MKTERQALILELIRSHQIETQEELAAKLKEAGMEVTQATVSRDIRELRLIKVPAATDGYRYALPERAVSGEDLRRARRLFQDGVVEIDFSENIVVVKTLTGAANGVAAVLDALRIEGVIGSLAGDDAIFLVVKPKERAVGVVDELERLRG